MTSHLTALQRRTRRQNRQGVAMLVVSGIAILGWFTAVMIWEALVLY